MKRVATAAEMFKEAHAALPADIAVFAAAVADWRMAKPKADKLKKSGGEPPALKLVENADILKSVGRLTAGRPALVIGFAAETDEVTANAAKKLKDKGADWIVANDVSPASGVMGGDSNRVHLMTKAGVETWTEMSKAAVADALMRRAAEALSPGRAAAE